MTQDDINDQAASGECDTDSTVETGRTVQTYLDLSGLSGHVWTVWTCLDSLDMSGHICSNTWPKEVLECSNTWPEEVLERSNTWPEEVLEQVF